MAKLRFWSVLLIAGSIAATAGGRPVSASTCATPPLLRQLAFRDGASGFPTDGRIRILFSGPWEDSLLDRIAEEYRLTDSLGAVIPMESSRGGRLLSLAPTTPLKPQMQYRLEQLHAYDAAGALVDDDDRRYVRRPTVVRRWYNAASFTTADGPAETAGAAPPRLTGGRVYGTTVPGWPIFSVNYEGQPRIGDVWGIEARDMPDAGILFWTIPASDAMDGVIGFGVSGGCGDDPMVMVAGAFEFRLVARSANDALRFEPRWTEAGRPLVERILSFLYMAERIPHRQYYSRSGAPRRTPVNTDSWFSAPIDTQILPPSPTAEGCPHGLRSAVSWNTGGAGDPVGMAWLGNRGAVAAVDGKDFAFRFFGGAITKSDSPVRVFDKWGHWEPRAVFRGDRAVTVHTVLREEDRQGRARVTKIVVGVYDLAQGREVWRREIGGAELNYYPVAAWGEDRIVVAWKIGSGLEGPIQWAALSAADGTPIGAEQRLAERAWGDLSVFFDDGRFLVSWAGERWDRTRLAAIGRDGASIVSELNVSGSAFAFARTPSGIAVAWYAADGVRLGRLADDGRALRGPAVDVSRGAPSAPEPATENLRDTRGIPHLAATGDLVAVAWTGQGRALNFVAVADPSGGVSPSLSLPSVNYSNGRPALAPMDEGFVTAYQSYSPNSRPVSSLVTEKLVCRTDARDPAPFRLQRSGVDR